MCELCDTLLLMNLQKKTSNTYGEIGMLRLLSTRTDPLHWFKLTGIDDTKVEKKLSGSICFNILGKIEFMAQNVIFKKNSKLE